MDLEKHEIIFRVKDDEITFKEGKGNLLPKNFGSISMVGKIDNENRQTELAGYLFPSAHIS
ncbi:hypothetical protein HAX54_036604, partial [Datura stramonium]|nr:hypothetical protein [Datura stramonium]